MKEKVNKTNAMRILDKMSIHYDYKIYEVDEDDLSGEHLAKQLQMNPAMMFKTLVAKGDRTGYVVACIPVDATLDLKAFARVSGNKNVEMLHVKDLLGVTGYIRGGCSPVGMKKKFPTYMDETIQLHDVVAVSAGVRGIQLLIKPEDLLGAVSGQIAALTASVLE